MVLNIPLETEPRTLSNMGFHTCCVPGHLPSMIWSLHLSSTCPRGPSPSISWRIRYTSYSHLLSGCETHSLNSSPKALLPTFAPGPSHPGSTSGHFSPVFVPCGFFLKSKYLSTELQENTRALSCPGYVAHTALKVTIHSET